MGFGLEIKRLRKEAPISAEKLADLIGLDAARMRKWEEKDLTPRLEDVQKIEKFFGMTIAEVMQLASIKKFLIVPHENGSLNDYVSARRALKLTDSQFLVPLVPVKAQAGYARGYNNTDFMKELQVFPILPGVDPRGADWRYFEVEGDSMLDTLKDGQVVLASQVIREDWQNIENFLVYVIITEEKVMIKRLGKVKGKNYWAVMSDNEDRHPQFRLPIDDVRELWKYRRHIEWDVHPPKRFEIKV